MGRDQKQELGSGGAFVSGDNCDSGCDWDNINFLIMYKKIFLKIIIVALLFTLPFSALAAGKTNSAKKATKAKAKQSAKVTTKSSTNKKMLCSANIYNCKDFATQKAAQEVYEACLAQAGKDVHDLDRDKDGKACEENK